MKWWIIPAICSLGYVVLLAIEYFFPLEDEEV
jgi:hypothetical protein